jgi:hypothetical protein
MFCAREFIYVYCFSRYSYSARLRGEDDRFVVTIGNGYRDGSAGVVGLSAVGRSAARLALESRHPARAHPPGAFQDYAPCAHAPQESRKSGAGARWLLPFRNVDPS